jgi:RNA polymerase sigma-70 factor (ECF subfamily)
MLPVPCASERAQAGDVMQIAHAISDIRAAKSPAARTATPDNALIDAIAAGDTHAMHVLFARHSARIYRFILRMTRSESLAEELLNEVFVEAWRQAGKFEGRSQASTWLLGIARFKALNAMRRRQDEELNEDALAQVEDTADNAEAVLERADRASQLRRCLCQLSLTHREVIDLVYYHEKSVAEASEIIGLPPGTVKTRMYYARKKLAELLKAAGVD